MDSIHTRNLTIEQALESYAILMSSSCCTSYVIIKETAPNDQFGVVPKISCWCSRAFKKCCGSANYYTKEQADKTVIATYIHGLMESGIGASDNVFIALEFLTPKFGDKANIVNTLGVNGVLARREAQRNRVVRAQLADFGLGDLSPSAAASPIGGSASPNGAVALPNGAISPPPAMSPPNDLIGPIESTPVVPLSPAFNLNTTDPIS